MKFPQHLDVPCVRMKRIFSSLAVGALLLSGFLSGGARVAQGQTLSLVWSDEFNGASIDLTKWTFDLGNGGDLGGNNPGWGNDELEFYTSNSANAYVTNGFLHIRAMIQSTNDGANTFNYTSARMKTQGLFWKTYGRIEWRASLPSGTGFWPALWMLGTNINSIGWPGCGEIDVVENNGTPNFEQGSIHSGTDATEVYNFTGGNSVTNFHVYDLDWMTNSSGGVSIIFSVDGTAYETQTNWGSSADEPYPFPFNQPFFFLMNLAVGGNYLDNPSTSAINPNMPGELVIDYMRIFNYSAPTNPPTTPAGLSATLGSASVGLTWSLSDNAARYNVKRSFNTGGPYTIIGTPAATSYSDSNVVAGTTYYYVVSATNSIAESSNSLEANITPSPPPAPTGLMAAFGGASVALNWNAVTGATRYNVKRSLANGGTYTTIGTPTGTNYGDSNVVEGTTYYYVVSATNFFGESTNSVQVSATPLPPATPTGLTATPGGTSVALNWYASSNAVNYNVKRSLVTGGPYTTIASSSTTGYTDTNVTSCSSYYYVVSGTNSIGESANSTETSATLGPYYFAVSSGNTTPVGTFVADTDFTGGIQAAPTTATINTSNVTNPAPQAVYQHERYDDFVYTFGGLTTGTSYTVRLHFAEIYWTGPGEREFNVFINGSEVLTNFDIFATAGGENIAVIKQYSVMPMANGKISVTYSNGAVDDAKSSGIEIILPAPAAPVGVTATGEVGQVVLAWSAVSGATSYNVERSTVSGGPYTNVASGVTGATDTDTSVTNGTTYYYVVSAVENGCGSADSAEVNATPLTAFQQWQVQYFYSITNPLAAANVDADGTGQNNQFKYVAGLNPTNPSSVFLLTVNSVTNQPTQMNLLFNPMATGRTYTPQFNTDLVNGVWAPLTTYTGPATNGSQIMVTDTNALPSQEFYRIQISAP
jgi:beta-glucanase (GH16 family)